MLFDQKCCLTKSSEAPVGQKNKLLIPPIWECCGHTRDSFFTHGQIKNPALFEVWWNAGKMSCQIWA